MKRQIEIKGAKMTETMKAEQKKIDAQIDKARADLTANKNNKDAVKMIKAELKVLYIAWTAIDAER